MPGAPAIGREFGPYAKEPRQPSSALSSTAGDLLDTPQPELLGTISHDKLQREINQIESRKGVECVFVEGVLKCVVYTIPDVTS